MGGVGLKGKIEGWEVEMGDCKVKVGGEELKKARKILEQVEGNVGPGRVIVKLVEVFLIMVEMLIVKCLDAELSLRLTFSKESLLFFLNLNLYYHGKRIFYRTSQPG